MRRDLWDALPYVCMVRCGRPAVFVWLSNLYTIEDHVLCHATVVSSTNIIKAEESRHRTLLESQFNVYRRHFQHAHFMPIVGVGERGVY